MDLEEELEDVPVGGLLGIKDDLDCLGVTRMVVSGRVVVLPAGVADASGYDPGAMAQQLLRGPETAPGKDRRLGVPVHRYPPVDMLTVDQDIVRAATDLGSDCLVRQLQHA